MESPCKKTKLEHQQILVRFLTDDLIFNILVRLPVKSVIRFRGISRFWNSQLYSSLFIKDHLRLSTAEEGLDKLRMIILYPFHCLKSCSLYSLYHEPFGYSVDLDFPMKELHHDVHLVGSCNGLVCFYVEQEGFPHNLFLWNPSIRESRRLPDCLGYDRSSDFAFGYCETIDDYKVVKLVTGEGKSGKSEIFSLTTDTWKKFDDFPIQVNRVGTGVFVQGTLNWGVEVEFKFKIVSFDLAEEKFCFVPQPDYGEGMFEKIIKVLGQCLSVLCDKADTCVDVWMMKEYGAEKSWTKMYTVPYAPGVIYPEVPRSFCFTRHGGILMYFGRTLVLYDLKSNKFSYPVIYGVQDCHEAYVYVESLVSPIVYKQITCETLILEGADQGQ